MMGVPGPKGPKGIIVYPITVNKVLIYILAFNF